MPLIIRPKMSLMQLIKHVLDDAYNSIDESDPEIKDASIKQEILSLARSYSKLTALTGPSIDYSNPLSRFAYIYRYSVAHADYIMQLTRSDQGLAGLFRREQVDVACLGGGPGSDFLGILKFLVQSGTKEFCLNCQIYDKERAWIDSWSDVAPLLNAPFRFFPIFAQLDVTDPSTWVSYRKLLSADLYTLSYFLSEVWRIKKQAEPFFKHCLSSMKVGSLVLFIDNNDSRFVNWFDSLAAQHGLVAVVKASGTLCFSNDEEKSDFGIYFEKFGWMKRSSEAAWRIMRKE